MTDAVDVGLLIIRVTLGAVFIAHGIKHALGRQKTTNWFEWLGFRQAGFQWLMMTLTEIGIGLLLIVGLLNSLAAAGVIATMFVAYWTVHRQAGFFITAFMKEGIDVEGWEYVLTLGMAGLALAVTGPGTISIDDGLGIADNLDGWVGLAIAVAGLLLAFGQLAMFWRPASSQVST